MAKRKNSRRRNPSKAETGLLSLKGIATILGLWWAYSAYKKKTEAADAQKAAAEAQAQAAKDPVGTAAASFKEQVNLENIRSQLPL